MGSFGELELCGKQSRKNKGGVIDILIKGHGSRDVVVTDSKLGSSVTQNVSSEPDIDIELMKNQDIHKLNISKRAA